MTCLPRIDFRYWILMLVASASGTNFGDFASQSMQLGFAGGFIPFAVIFLTMIIAARRFAFFTEAYYWIAIVVSRAGATDIADLATHQMRLEYPILASVLLLLLTIIILGGARLGQTTISSERIEGREWENRPSANATYWAAIIVASVFGTVTGDFLADDVGMETSRSALVTTALSVLVLALLIRPGRILKPAYWLAILAIRTAATNLGDYVAGQEGLAVGFLASGSITLALLLITTFIWRPAITSDMKQGR